MLQTMKIRPFFNRGYSMQFYALLLLSACTLVAGCLYSSKQSDKKSETVSTQALFPDGSIKELKISDYLGKKVILYFYPKNGTPGCTKQAKIFRDNFKDLQTHGIIVIGVSYDSLESHKKFQTKHKLPFILVTDNSKKLTKLYNSYGIFFASRKTVLLDEKGKVIKRFESVDIPNQINDIFQAFKIDKSRVDNK